MIAPAVTPKPTVVEPDGTETDAGAVSAGLLLESATVPPAVFDSVTVQLAAPPLLRVDGVQPSELMVVGAVREIDDDCDVPFNDPVTVAVASDVIVPAVAVNVALVLDRSGSMAGRKLEVTKACAAYLARRLAPTDRIALVTYD